MGEHEEFSFKTPVSSSISSHGSTDSEAPTQSCGVGDALLPVPGSDALDLSVATDAGANAEAARGTGELRSQLATACFCETTRRYWRNPSRPPEDVAPLPCDLLRRCSAPLASRTSTPCTASMSGGFVNLSSRSLQCPPGQKMMGMGQHTSQTASFTPAVPVGQTTSAGQLPTAMSLHVPTHPGQSGLAVDIWTLVNLRTSQRVRYQLRGLAPQARRSQRQPCQCPTKRSCNSKRLSSSSRLHAECAAIQRPSEIRGLDRLARDTQQEPR